MYPFAILFNINANRSFGIKNHRHIPFRMRNTDKKESSVRNGLPSEEYPICLSSFNIKYNKTRTDNHSIFLRSEANCKKFLFTTDPARIR